MESIESEGRSAKVWQRVCELVSCRAAAWYLIADSFRQPDINWTQNLLTGEFEKEWRHVIKWLDEDRIRFDSAFVLLDGYLKYRSDLDTEILTVELETEASYLFVGTLNDRDTHIERSLIVDGYATPRDPMVKGIVCEWDEGWDFQQNYTNVNFDLNDPRSIVRIAMALYECCSQEALYWSSGEVNQAKEIRSREQKIISECLVGSVPHLYTRISAVAPEGLYRVLVEFFRVVVMVESGLV